MKKIILVSVLLLHTLRFEAMATTRKVLFIGNSYTSTNNMPLIVQNLATAMGDTLIWDVSDPGGYTFAMHSTYAPTLTKIFSQPWDIVVLQEQSELPSFPPAEVDTEVYPYAHVLDSLIHANDSCTQTMFLMTWGHADGDPLNCGFYPVICTYNGMQQRLRESYLQMTQDNNAIVAPVGAAWQIMMDSFASSIWLYSPDSSHPVVSGSYLESCVVYSSIFHKPTLGCTYTDGITTTDANTIQRVSDKVVIDSLTNWQQYGHYPYAGFVSYTYADSFAFNAISPINNSFSWYVSGSGTTISDTIRHFVGRYDTSMTFTIVSLTAYNNCFSETLIDTIYRPVGLRQLQTQNSPIIIAEQAGNGTVTFTEPIYGLIDFDVLDVYDAKGALVKQYTCNGLAIKDNFIPGLYIIRAYSLKTGNSFYCKLIVY